MKKILTIVLTALLTLGALAGCAGQNPVAGQNNASQQSNAPVIHQTATQANGTSSPTVSPNASAAYKKLLAYKTEDYGQQSVADFNAALASTPDELTVFLAEIADVISTISPDDENYDFFTTTIFFSANELYCEYMGEEVAFSFGISRKDRPCDYLDDEGNPVYEFTCYVELQVPYSINSPQLVSVAERDKVLLTFQEEMQNYLNGLSETEITSDNIKKTLTDKATELVNTLSTENIQLLSCDSYMIEIYGAEEAK